MAREKSITGKAKDLGIDLNKETLGSLIDRLHTCQTGGNSVDGTARKSSKKIVSKVIKTGKKAKKAIKDAGSGVVDAVCENR